MNDPKIANNIRVVDKYQFNECDLSVHNNIREVHAVHRDTKEEYTLRSIELDGKNQHIYDYLQQQLIILKWLSHPEIVKCHRIFKTRNNLYFVYDSTPGYSLSELLEGGCTFRRVIEIVTGLLKVLAYLDQREVVHGQLDPEAIVLFGGAKLMLRNFGYGAQIVKQPMPLPAFHRHRSYNHYTPPEAYQMTLTSRSDVYSIGCIISSLLQAVRGASDRQSECSLHITHFAEKMQAKKSEARPDIQEVIEYFRSQPYEKKIKTIKAPSMKKKSTTPQCNSAKLKLRQFPNSEATPVLLDCNRQGRKVLAKRNLQKFLLEVAHLCGRAPLETSKSLSLGVIMIKKATILAGQLLKLLNTGSGDNLKIDQRTLSRINKHTLFIQLQAMISREKEELQELFDFLSKAIREKLTKQDHSALHRQLTVEQVDSNFLKKSLFGWLGDAIEWLKQQSVHPPKKDLVLICALVFLLEYPSIQEGFNILCGQNGVDLWQQPLFLELEAMSDYNLQRLIVLQGQGKGLSEDSFQSGGSSKAKDKTSNK